jgi:hypothetical protein
LLSKKMPRDNFLMVIAILCVILAVAFTAIIYSAQIIGLQEQINNYQYPKLVNVSLAWSVSDEGYIHVAGYVYNIGNYTAYGSHVQVDQYRNGAITNTTYVFFGNDTVDTIMGSEIPGGTSAHVDANVTYTGSKPTNVTLTLGWTQPWQLPIP